MPLSTAMPLSNDIEREKFPKQLSMSSSSHDLSQPLEMTEPGLMLPSGHLSRLSKATTLKLMQRPRMGERSSRNTAPPALLYQFQMDTSPMMESQALRGSRSTNQYSHGSPVDETNMLSCGIPSPKPSNLSKPTPLILKPLSNHLSMNRIVPSSRILNGKISSAE